MNRLIMLCVVVAGCGGGDSGEPIRSGTVTGVYSGSSFDVVNGYAVTYNGDNLIVLGDGPVHCGSETATNPPTGTNAIIAAPAFTVGSYSNVEVQALHVSGSDYAGVSSNSGSLNITAVTADTVSGDVSFSYTDSSSHNYQLNGTFMVTHCQ